MSDLSLLKIEKLFFNIINVLFHPIFVPFYSLYAIIHIYSQYYVLNENAVFYLLVAFFIITVLLPSLVFLTMNYLKIITSVHIKSKEERLSVVFTMFLFYVFLVFYFRNVSFPYFIEIYLFALPIIILFLFALQWIIKISLHTYAIGSLLGIIIFYRIYLDVLAQFYIIGSIILMAGFIISARLLSNAHNIKETIIGFFAGVLIAFLCILVAA